MGKRTFSRRLACESGELMTAVEEGQMGDANAVIYFPPFP